MQAALWLRSDCAAREPGRALARPSPMLWLFGGEGYGVRFDKTVLLMVQHHPHIQKALLSPPKEFSLSLSHLVAAPMPPRELPLPAL